MSVINTILGVPLGYLVYFAYWLTGNYGLAILIFAVFVKIVLFPVNVFTHKNAIRLLQIQPKLNEIKQRYPGDKERVAEEQYNLYQTEKYSPFVGIIPMVVQLLLIVGVLQVMYNPLQHMLHFDKATIDAVVQLGRDWLNVRPGSGEQLMIINAAHDPQNWALFRQGLAGIPDAESVLQQMANINLSFLGLNLGEIPSLKEPSIALLIPALSGSSALAMCMVQNVISPGALSQGRGTKWGLTLFTVAFSLYFTCVVPVGVGIYWTAGNILGIVVAVLLNVLYSPKKLAGQAIAQIEASRKTPSQLLEERQKNKMLKARSKQDAARFAAAEKHLVFYALTGGQYKYYKNIIEYVLAHSNITIHYLTNDENDSLLQTAPERLIPYYSTQNKTISLLLKLDADIVVTTVQDLQSYHLKRSIVRDDIEYIYTFHGLGSTHLMARPTAYDHFNTVFCVGPHQVTELRRREEMASMPKKSLVKVGYGLYDQLAASYAKADHTPHARPKILIAPSWQEQNILDLCIDEMLNSLLGHGYDIIVRPHPQYTRLFPERVETLEARYADAISHGELVVEKNFFSNESTFSSDLLITDWSGIAFEFAFCTKKPCVFINTPMKIVNEQYEEYGLDVLDITLRSVVGVSVEPEQLHSLASTVEATLAKKSSYELQIEQAVKDYLFYPGRSGEAGGKYILRQLESRSIR